MSRDYLRDKSWMYAFGRNRTNPQFVQGVYYFTSFAFSHRPSEASQILCPCSVCQNSRWYAKEEVEIHIIYNGFVSDYTIWTDHGETEDQNDMETRYEIPLLSEDFESGGDEGSEDEREIIDDLEGMVHEREIIYLAETSLPVKRARTVEQSQNDQQPRTLSTEDNGRTLDRNNGEHDGHTSEQEDTEHDGNTLDQHSGNIGSSSSGANPTGACKPFVLPSHLRRSARASRSKYRHPTEDTTTSNADMATPEVQMENPDVTTMPLSVQKFTQIARRSHNPSSCRPQPGEPPLALYWWKGCPVGPNAVKFSDYCGEEAKRYDRYPLHKRWDSRQTDYACSLFKTALMKKHYIYFGEEDPDPDHEGETLPVDQRKAEDFLYHAIKNMKKDWRHTVKREYFLPWEEADNETRSAILEGLDPRIPKDKWPLLCAYYSSPEKKAEAKRNSENRKSTKKLRPTCTTGRKRLMNVYHALKKQQGKQFKMPKAFVHGHTRPGTENEYPDDATRQYCEKVETLGENVPLESQQNLSSLSSITDAISGGHHGGYERGVGSFYSRKSHKAAEKLPMMHFPASRRESEEMLALRNEVNELKRREREREKQQATLNERVPFATRQTMDILEFASFLTQCASQLGITLTGTLPGMTNLRTTRENNGPRSRANRVNRSKSRRK